MSFGMFEAILASLPIPMYAAWLGEGDPMLYEKFESLKFMKSGAEIAERAAGRAHALRCEASAKEVQVSAIHPADKQMIDAGGAPTRERLLGEQKKLLREAETFDLIARNIVKTVTEASTHGFGFEGAPPNEPVGYNLSLAELQALGF